MRTWRSVLLAAALGAAAVVAPAPAGAQGSYPVTPSFPVGAIQGAADPAAPPAGANVAGCHSTVNSHPVVLVDGTFANPRDDFGALAPLLANAGYCVYTFSYGAPPSQFVQGLGPVPRSAQQLAAYVQHVRVTTGASQVDLVGHSQGGLLAEYYVKLLGGAAYVHDVVGLSPTTHGTTAGGLTKLTMAYPAAATFLGSVCQACVDQETGSPVIQALDSGPIAQPGVHYTVIETRNETVVTPAGASFIREPGVANEWVQSYCPFDSVDHANLPYDLVVVRLVRNALEPATARPPDCLTEFPLPA
jgi:triacylglycerol esterase/lipase EstA (alpha/beta hydrolase family)